MSVASGGGRAHCGLGPIELQTALRVGPVTDLPGMEAHAISAPGTAVGSQYGFVGPPPDYAIVTSPVAWDEAGSATTLSGFGGAQGVNANGTIVGSAQLGPLGTPNAVQAWQFAPGGGTRLMGPTGSTWDVAVDIADDGAVVGNAMVSGVATPWWRPSGGATAIVLPAGGPATVTGVDNHGKAVGWRTLGATQVPVRWDLVAATVTDLALPQGASSGRATDVSDAGVIAGSANGQAVWWDPAGSVHQIALGSGEFEATAVNDLGVVVVAAAQHYETCGPAGYYATRSYVVDTTTGEWTQLFGDPYNDDFYPTDVNDAGTGALSQRVHIRISCDPPGIASPSRSGDLTPRRSGSADR